MFPVLFELFGFPVPSYAVLMVLGFIVALLALFKLVPPAPEVPLDSGPLHRAQVWDLYVVMVVSSIIGSKVGHVLFEAPGHVDADGHHLNSLWELLKSDPWHWAKLGESGYVWYGGLLGALGTAVFYFWRRPRLSAWLYSDTFAPSIVAGAAVGRIGCFLAGCCYGKPTQLPWGVRFPGMNGPVHPTQLYDSLSALCLALFLFWNYPRRKFDGENIAWLLILYPVLRSLSESVRGDADRGGLGVLSTSQLISIPLFLIGLWIYASRRRAQAGLLPAAPEAKA
jgi:phosphatidylglycerol:prolipoprotein diacylglycerol transferase